MNDRVVRTRGMSQALASSRHAPPVQLSEDRTHRCSEMAEMLLQRADALHSSLTAAAEEEMAEWELQIERESQMEQDLGNPSPGRRHDSEAHDAFQLQSRVKQRMAVDRRKEASAEVRRLRANVEKAKQNLKAEMQRARTGARVGHQSSDAKLGPQRQARPREAPMARAAASTHRSASRPSQDPRLQALLLEVSRCEAEVSSLRERELALVGVLASHRHQQRR